VQSTQHCQFTKPKPEVSYVRRSCWWWCAVRVRATCMVFCVLEAEKQPAHAIESRTWLGQSLRIRSQSLPPAESYNSNQYSAHNCKVFTLRSCKRPQERTRGFVLAAVNVNRTFSGRKFAGPIGWMHANKVMWQLLAIARSSCIPHSQLYAVEAGAGLGSTLSVIPVYSFQKSLSQFTLSVQITCVRILSECEHAVLVWTSKHALQLVSLPTMHIWIVSASTSQLTKRICISLRRCTAGSVRTGRPAEMWL